MTLYQVFLQGAQFIGGYIYATQGTEACGDTVQRFFGLGYLMIEVVATFLYPFFSFGGKFQFQILVVNSFDDVVCELTGHFLMVTSYTFQHSGFSLKFICKGFIFDGTQVDANVQ